MQIPNVIEHHNRVKAHACMRRGPPLSHSPYMHASRTPTFPFPIWQVKEHHNRVKGRPGVKGRASAERKLKDKYRGDAGFFRDLARATVLFETGDDLLKVLDGLEAAGLEVAQLKNKFAHPTPLGYRARRRARGARARALVCHPGGARRPPLL